MTLHNEIRRRQIGPCGMGGRAALMTSRWAYTELVPNHIIYRVQTPPDTLIIRFTLDGKYLLCVSKGTANDVHLYYTKTSRCPMDATHDELCFSHYFGLKYKQPVKTLPGHSLCKDFCLLMNNLKYMILASSKVVNLHHAYPLTLDGLQAYCDYAFYSIDIETGQTIGHYTLSSDYLFLTQNASVSMHGQMLAILSLKSQEIKLLLVDIDGCFHELRSTGTYLRPDDKLVIDRHEQYLSDDSDPSAADPPTQTPPCSHYLHGDATLGQIPLKRNHETEYDDTDDGLLDQDPPLYGSFQQTFLSYLFRSSSSIGGIATRQFYRNFKVYSTMKLWRIQFLDEHTLLIKLHPSTTTLAKLMDPTNHPLAIFVILNLTTYEISKVFDQGSEQVVEAFKEYAVRGDPPPGMTWFGSHSNKRLTRYLQVQRSEAIQQLAQDLPILAQSYMDCPYFDLSLFHYDYNLFSLVSSKLQTTETVYFYSTITKQLLFKIDPNPSNAPLFPRRLATMIPHPIAPFIITTQYAADQPPIINFHVYKPSCC